MRYKHIIYTEIVCNLLPPHPVAVITTIFSCRNNTGIWSNKFPSRKSCHVSCSARVQLFLESLCQNAKYGSCWSMFGSDGPQNGWEE